MSPLTSSADAVRMQHGSFRRLRRMQLALLACAVIALAVPVVAHAGISPPKDDGNGGLGAPFGSVPPDGSASSTTTKLTCPTPRWKTPPTVVVHLTEFERGDSDPLAEFAMVAGIQNVVDQFSQMGGSSAAVKDVTTSREDFTFTKWYHDASPTIHVGFGTASDLAAANATPQGPGVVGGATRIDPLLSDGCLQENHIIFPDSATLPWNFGTPFLTPASNWFDAHQLDPGFNEDGSTRERRNWFRPGFLHELLHAFGLKHSLRNYSFMNYPTAYANVDKTAGGYPWANRPSMQAVRPLPDDVRQLRELYPKDGTTSYDVGVFNTWWGPPADGVDAAGSYPLCTPSLGAAWSSDLSPDHCGVDGVDGENQGKTSYCPGDTVRTRFAVANYSTEPVNVTARLWMSRDLTWQSTDTISATVHTKTLANLQSELWEATWKLPDSAAPMVLIRVDTMPVITGEKFPIDLIRTDWIPLRGALTRSSSCR